MLATTADTGLNFDNSYARLPDIFFTRQNPATVKKPEIVLLNSDLAADLGLNIDMFQTPEGVAILAGNAIPENAAPLAQAYAGHQFGHFGMLGDGRAILLGEQITPDGKRIDLQLKGAGPTPYSRGGDGRAALGPMLREYIISEAMFYLGIPTTRSLAVLTTGEKVYREKALAGAILVRTASSHLRVGTFQYAAAWGTRKELKTLADYAIERHFPGLGGKDKYKHFLQNVIQAQADLVASWMMVGFVHGVMNTDNMAISGETIDYGPCAFIDNFDPATVFSSIDHAGRYAYGNQPKIALWNLTRFAETLLPLLADNLEDAMDYAQLELEKFEAIFNRWQSVKMGLKLGITNEEDGDAELFSELLQLMYKYKADYTNTFLDLTFQTASQKDLFNSPEFSIWQQRWEKRKKRQPDEVKTKEIMKENNPAIIPRNFQVEKVLRAAIQAGDFIPLQKLLKALKNPFAHTAEQKKFNQPPPPSAKPYRTFCGT